MKNLAKNSKDKRKFTLDFTSKPIKKKIKKRNNKNKTMRIREIIPKHDNQSK